MKSRVSYSPCPPIAARPVEASETNLQETMMAHANTAMLAIITTTHVVIVVALILLLFGGKKLPELARGMARGLRIFRDELHGIQREITDAPPAAPPTPPQDTKPAEQPPSEKKP